MSLLSRVTRGWLAMSIERSNPITAVHAVKQSGLFFGLASFGLMWIALIQYHEIYALPDGNSIPLLADGLLLGPGAHWLDWFTRGYSHFWDLYPDWPSHGGEATATDFTRPAFQFIIYLAHFVVGRDWGSYQFINCLAVAGTGAVALQIAQTALGLGTGPSVVVATLVMLSPPVLQSWLWGLGFAIEPLATVIVAGAFLAVLARRDFLCLALLFLALLTKENTVWAPFAAAITIMLRPKLKESLRRRVLTALAMFLPVAMWLSFRFAFFGGVGGTYATQGYTPLVDFLKLVFYKLTHMQYLFINHQRGTRGTALMILDRGTDLLIYALLLLWGLRFLTKANYLRYVTREASWPIVDSGFLLSLWAALGLAFHFALPLLNERYATSVVVFVWPAVVAEVVRLGKAIVYLGLGAICVLSLAHASYRIVEYSSQTEFRSYYKSMNAALRRAPAATREIYVISTGGLPYANPKYVRLLLGVSAEIIRVIEIDWECRDASNFVAFDYSAANGVVSLTITLPTCATFPVNTNRFNGITNGYLDRNDTMSYELPDAYPWKGNFILGRRMIVHVRPNGPARFIIEHGGPSGITWFDTS
jgi:hypothetical protein